MSTPFGFLGVPEDALAWTALGLAFLTCWISRKGSPLATRLARFSLERPGVCALSLALLAASLSVGYVAYYLRGGPRIIDATSYFLEARTFASGRWSLGLPDPSGSFRGRFLLPSLDGLTQAVLFPPGYPALLATGFWLQAPMLIGPAIAACLVLATYTLALEIFQSKEGALLAALLSALCAALRYHTADTMSHGLAALLLTLSLLGSFRGSRAGAAAAGLALGWLVATRPLTGIVGVLACAPWLIQSRAWPALFTLLPGITLLGLYQRHATGSLFESVQHAYYALSDGPKDCFRLGFGAGIGCRFEHGEFVQRELQNGYGLREASLVTTRRLALHVGDLTNFMPAAALLPWIAKSTFANLKARTIVATTCLLVGAYALFYFDGNYPGGGARLYADLLPLEHVLLGWGLSRLRLARWLMPAGLLGFALHVGHGHLALREREGGRPMFEAQVLTRANVSQGLLFINTDHGFNLAHDPSLHTANSGVFVARSTRDARERSLWLQLGRPPAFRYEFDPWHGDTVPSLEQLEFTSEHARTTLEDPQVYELEYEWPPLARLHGWAKPSHAGASCVSLGRGLRLLADRQGKASVQVDIARPHAIETEVELTYWVKQPGVTLSVRLVAEGLRRSLVERVPTVAGGCQRLEFSLKVLQAGTPQARLRLELEAQGPEILLDTLRVRTQAKTR